MSIDFYSLQINCPKGQKINFSDFQGKFVLVVNTATKCGLTPQLEGLEALHQKYKDNGLVILGAPCNQFANQEPETNDTIESVCLINHGVTFQLTEKIDVNGKDTHPVFQFLKQKLRGGLFGSKVKWNFTKFLIDANGKPIKRYGPTTKPERIEKDLEKLLK